MVVCRELRWFAGLLCAAASGALCMHQPAARAAESETAYLPYAPARLSAADYDRAARLLAPNAAALVRNAEVRPHWVGWSNLFWYRRETAAGFRFMLVDAASRRVAPAFDHEALAAALGRAAGRAVLAEAMPFTAFSFDERREAIRFDAWGMDWHCTLRNLACDHAPRRESPPGSRVSPDGTHAVFRRARNLWLKDLRTGEEHPLTADGEQFNEYGWLSGNSQAYLASERSAADIPPMAVWSPDSARLLTHRIDERQVTATSVSQNAPAGGLRPRIWEYRQSFPGDAHEPQTHYVIFDVIGGRRVDVRNMPNPGAFYAPAGDGWSWWAPDSRAVYFLSHDRYFKTVGLYRLDSDDGSVHLIHEESGATYVGLNGSYQPAGQVTIRVIGQGKRRELIWFSERDGWGHLYRYNLANGVLKNRITSGRWAVYDIVHIDERRGIVYLLGAGREAGSNPYETSLYRVNLDGTGFRLLTPEDANHSVRDSSPEENAADSEGGIAPNGLYFVDTYSRADTRPVSVLRSTADGRVLLVLESADSSALESSGWRWPVPFTVKARDGVTDIYGTMFRPSHLEAGKKYPVIDLVYPSPWHIFPDVSSFNAVSGGLNQYRVRQALAELGFVVINLQGLGTPGRGKAFLDLSYGNLQDGPGLADQVTGITELARAHPEIDLTRVGVFGHSSGGYGALLAMLRFPDFFKVGVAGAPAVDMRGLVSIVLEGYQGEPGDNAKNYDPIVLKRLAAGLKGHLLLSYGDLDENAPPATALQFVEALNRANRNYDLLAFPNRDHSFALDPYYLRRACDYFVRNLMGSEPPANYAFPAWADNGPER
jgi:dipeptidyl-peptidase 4